ncbi:hypothetical protein RB608_17690 [Nocardioides sp. LHD-245]|uniref:hypothetical protein n=1 Tax=Nocardioides sp. LHD-245 TaxID=3051387 RepID=UPI0027E122F2|nr:hypothetical protein [Nocardioides sp. LHD-245]
MKRYEEPRARPAVIIATAVLAVVVAAVGVVLAIGPAGGMGERSMPSGEGTSPPVASVHRDHESACQAFRAAALNRSVAPAVAAEDRAMLARSLLRDRPEGGVRSIGLSMCGNAEVVVVGVADDAVRVPAAGPGGTPVLAYLQAGALAF